MLVLYNKISLRLITIHMYVLFTFYKLHSRIISSNIFNNFVYLTFYTIHMYSVNRIYIFFSNCFCLQFSNKNSSCKLLSMERDIGNQWFAFRIRIFPKKHFLWYVSGTSTIKFFYGLVFYKSSILKFWGKNIDAFL